MATGYANPSDLKKFTLNTRFLETVTYEEQVAALEAASDIVDSYLRAQFVLPLKQWGQDIVHVTCCLARYQIAVMRGYNPSAGADENIRLRYEDCIRWLERVSEGDAVPNITDSSTGPVPVVQAQSSSQRGFSFRGTGQDPGPFEGD